MNAPSNTDNILKTLQEELSTVRRQLATLQRQSAASASILAQILDKLNELSVGEQKINRDLDNIESEISTIVATASRHAACPVCGGPLDHHPASEGDLCICSACGFSEFVDRHGIVRSASAQPAPAPLAPAPPPSWVG